MLQLAPDLWVIEKPFALLGISLGVRMTIIRLASGEIVLISPVKISPEEKSVIDALGTVRYLVAPNSMHHLFMKAFTQWYPQAERFVVPLLAKKRPDFLPATIFGEASIAAWNGVIDFVFLPAARVFEEVLFFHKPSRSLVLTDLAFNIQRAPSLLGRVILTAYGVYGRFGPSVLERLLLRNKRACREAIDQALAWNPERIIVAHGDVLESDAAATLRDAFSWLRPV